MRRIPLILRPPKPPPVRECDLQATIVQGLRLLRYEVLVTSRNRQKVVCVKCGLWQWPKVFSRKQKAMVPLGDGCDKGIPDLLVWISERQGWLGLEVKGTGTAVSEEQKRLAGEGKVCIVRTWEEALAAVRNSAT